MWSCRFVTMPPPLTVFFERLLIVQHPTAVDKTLQVCCDVHFRRNMFLELLDCYLKG